MIDKGADVMYAERFGVSDAAKERGKLAIGNVINTQDKYPDTVVASALWNMEPTIDAALKAADVRAVKVFPPPTETNFAAAWLTGTLDECEAAAMAYAEAVVEVAGTPIR